MPSFWSVFSTHDEREKASIYVKQEKQAMNKPVLTLAQRAGEKVDFRKQLRHLYNPSANKVVVVDIPDMPFLMVAGTGNPNTS